MHLQFLTALALALPVTSRIAGNAGCFNDAGSLQDQGSHSYQSPGYCLAQCHKNGSMVAALTRGSHCYCGNEKPPQSAKVDDEQCNMRCVGWPRVMCGGHNAFTVIAPDNITGEEETPESASSNPSPTAVPSASTAVGGILVASTDPNEASMPAGIVTAPASMVAKASASLIAGKSAAAASQAVPTAGSGGVEASSSPSPTPSVNAAHQLHAGSSVVGFLVLGLALLL
ncbi:hypothetical protein NUU61_000542 [Penicillium alfredii]|uniref:WSC domain-containing protein n=1 Tax=Penicillium alfredii TaxID=1506179 RepID=A0A9W9GAA7_9EURO|nr:uncharacterized protein NUU61_000542 [Penicillium alfredii]KAJ5114783.1 hypothetical protein NUU61_000542 [Penicillium alfredii]